MNDEEAQAILAVNTILRALSDPGVIEDLMCVYFDLPCNTGIVAGEFDSIYQRWLQEEY